MYLFITNNLDGLSENRQYNGPSQLVRQENFTRKGRKALSRPKGRQRERRERGRGNEGGVEGLENLPNRFPDQHLQDRRGE